MALVNIALLTGNIGKPGGTSLSITAQGVRTATGTNPTSCW